jgi:hypothetical protein
VDGKAVKTIGQLIDLLEGYNVGDRVALTIRRDGTSKRLPVVLRRPAKGANGVYMSSCWGWPDLPIPATETSIAPASRRFVSAA